MNAQRATTTTSARIVAEAAQLLLQPRRQLQESRLLVPRPRIRMVMDILLPCLPSVNLSAHVRAGPASEVTHARARPAG